MIWYVLTHLAGKPSPSKLLHLRGCSHTFWRKQQGTLREATNHELRLMDRCPDCLKRA